MLLAVLAACLMTEADYQNLLVQSGDSDGDGYASTEWEFGTDCDDQDPNINPAAVEIDYNGQDDDCDPETRDDDLDEDGFGLSEDCDDLDPRRNPGAEETWYDGSDQDCDGNDSDADFDGSSWIGAGGDDCDDRNPDVQMLTWHPDIDGDSYGDPSSAQQDCVQPQDMIADGRDCDDSSALVHPGMPEQCENGIDDNCDGHANECAVPTQSPLRSVVRETLTPRTDIGYATFGVKTVTLNQGQNADVIVSTSEGCLVTFSQPKAWEESEYGCWEEGFGQEMAVVQAFDEDLGQILAVSGHAQPVTLLFQSPFDVSGLEELETLPLGVLNHTKLVETPIFETGGVAGLSVGTLGGSVAKVWVYSGGKQFSEDWVLSWSEATGSANNLSLAADDIDGDGLADIAVTVHGSSGSAIGLFTDLSAQTLTTGADAENLMATGAGQLGSTTLLDSNSDGWLDLLVAQDHSQSTPAGAVLFLGPLSTSGGTPDAEILSSEELPAGSVVELFDLEGDGGNAVILGLPNLTDTDVSGGIAAFALPLEGALDEADALWVLPDTTAGAGSGASLSTITLGDDDLPQLAISSLGDAESRGEVLLLTGHGL